MGDIPLLALRPLRDDLVLGGIGEVAAENSGPDGKLVVDGGGTVRPWRRMRSLGDNRPVARRQFFAGLDICIKVDETKSVEPGNVRRSQGGLRHTTGLTFSWDAAANDWLTQECWPRPCRGTMPLGDLILCGLGRDLVFLGRGNSAMGVVELAAAPLRGQPNFG